MAQERWRESHGMATSYRNWTKVNESRSGINNLLYAATRNTYHSESAEPEFKNQSQYGSLQMASKQYTHANPTKHEEKKFGILVGSFLS